MMSSDTHPHDTETMIGFIRTHTRLAKPPLVPELSLHLITPDCPLWRCGEAELEALGLPPPYWAFAWPGGQALARHLLDHPDLVRHQHVLDLGAGCGIEALAASLVGARSTLAADIDPYAEVACRLNAQHNGLELQTTTADVIGQDGPWDVILVGDLFYDAALAGRLRPWLTRMASRGTKVLLGDPYRGYLEGFSLHEHAQLLAPSDVDVEGAHPKWTAIWEVLPEPSPQAPNQDA